MARTVLKRLQRVSLLFAAPTPCLEVDVQSIHGMASENFTDILYHTILYYSLLYFSILYYNLLYYTVSNYTVLYYTVLQYNIV